MFEKFKRLADRKKEIYDSDIAALIEEKIRVVTDDWTFDSYSIQTASGKTPQVQLTIRHGDEEKTTEMACGDGPVDAIFLATEEITGFHVNCVDFGIHSVSVGKDAQGEVAGRGLLEW